MFFLTKKQRRKLNKIRANNIEDYKTWSVYVIVLPLAAFIFAFGLNMLFLLNHGNGISLSEEIEHVFIIINNGSLPIIGFGIVSSSITYLMEVIDEGKKSQTANLAYIRRKIMSISVLVLFLTSALYILQSISRDFFPSSIVQDIIIFVTTLVILILAISTGRKMFLLQKLTIENDYAVSIHKSTNSFSQGLENQFGLNEA